MSLFKHWLQMIKIEHTLFALPVVISAALLSLYNLALAANIPFYITDIFTSNLIWILLCFITARAAGMTLNRIFDAKIDAVNKRTEKREIPSGKISKIQAWIFAIICLVIFVYSALQLPLLCQQLLPVALLWLFLYSWLKRLTWLCHLFLGTILGGAALGSWIAIAGAVNSVAIVYFSLAISFWVAAFDVIYSLQDYQFDRDQNLHSIPVRFGQEGALMIVRSLHLLMLICLYLCGKVLGLGLFYKIGLVVVMAALYYEHLLVRQGKVEAAFFDVNSAISGLLMLFIILDLYEF